MDIAGQLIPIEDIDKLDDVGGMYCVISQSDQHMAYMVNFDDDYSCDCPSFPLMLYCKHLAAIHFHFYELLDIQPLELLLAPAIRTQHSIQSAANNSEHIAGSNTVQPMDTSLRTIAGKLERLAAHLYRLPLGHPTANVLQNLDHALDGFTQNPLAPHPAAAEVYCIKHRIRMERAKWYTTTYGGGHEREEEEGAYRSI